MLGLLASLKSLKNVLLAVEKHFEMCQANVCRPKQLALGGWSWLGRWMAAKPWEGPMGLTWKATLERVRSQKLLTAGTPSKKSHHHQLQCPRLK